MGNQPSNIKKMSTDTRLLNILNSIAAKYIAGQKFTDLTKLNNIEYCNKLTIITSDVLANTFNTQQIQYIDQRLKEGKEVNVMNRRKVLYLHKNDLNNLDIQKQSRKRKMCISIAKFYVKIAHLYNAILTTLNPQYRTNDSNIDIREKYMMQKKYLKQTKNNLCSRRINSLLYQQLKNVDTSKENDYEINPTVCDLNKDNLNKQVGDNTEKVPYTKSLYQEPGIPELKYLYYDIYDYNTGVFTGMTEKSQKSFNKDLEVFYKAFTGNKSMPNNIKDFSDIKLRDYHNNPKCNSILRQTVKGNMKSTLFKKYAEQMKVMSSNSANIRNQLISILNRVFIYKLDQKTKNKIIDINPKLTYESLDVIIQDARKIIVSLYVTCENDYINTLNIFEALVEDQIKRNTLRRMSNIEKQLEEQN